MTTKEKILAIKHNTQGDDLTIVDYVIQWANCHEAEVDDAGDIWICNPQRGHWLSDEQKAEFVAWCEAQ